ncbi:hypothetical protein T10_1214 [Trichinella papuae]|uniref:Uncharacterized protein n=1 Tax=Trichinella papuae TaxID=268474 RepID=A0A0V1M3E7_9BILA|nr:hypothetical protein T10_1214 [Trichinella papuae]
MSYLLRPVITIDILIILNTCCKIYTTYGWSDSQIALCWIRNAARNWKPFVRNRVELIHELVRPEDWRYCPMKENPADAITRGRTLRKLRENRLWWNGPKWLPDEKQWPKERFQQKMRKDTQNITEEERKLTAIVLNTNVENPPIFDSENFGNFEKMLRMTAYYYIGRTLRELTSGEIITAEKYWLKIVQKEAFNDELQVLQNGRPLTKENRLMGTSIKQRGIRTFLISFHSVVHLFQVVFKSSGRKSSQCNPLCHSS